MGRCSSLGESGLSSGCPITTQVGIRHRRILSCWPASASDNPRMRTADHAGQYQHRRLVTILKRKLLQAGGIAINNGSGRDAMDEVASAKAFVAKRARERRRSGGDHLPHSYARTLELVHQFPANDHSPDAPPEFVRSLPDRHMAVIVMQARNSRPASAITRTRVTTLSVRLCSMPVRFIPGFMSRKISTRQVRHCRTCSSFSARTENANVRKLLRNVPYPAAFAAHRGISEEHVGCAAPAGHQQFQCGRALEIADAALNQHAQSMVPASRF